MEKIKVNMSPNPLDVQTIHASQNDGEAREWEFELHNNGELIDTSDVKEQLVFKAYKGGTEQLLPENTSTPTTSPFKGDIRYPQGLLTDQEFTYRQSPTEEDGLAKITDIKGNTLVWNQLCRTLTSGNWAIVGAGSGTITFADGVATFSTTNNYGRFLYTPNNLVSGHKYLLSVEIKAYTNASINYALGSQSSYGSQGCICSTGTVSDANWHRYTSVGTFTSGTDDKVLVQNNSGASNLHEIQVRNIMYFDLTQMGLDITDPSDFTSLFPLSYYSYNQGSLLSFNGNGIKTIGKNLFQNNAVNTTLNGITFTINDDKSVTVNGTATGNAGLTRFNGLVVPNIKKGESLILSGGLNRPIGQAYLQLVYIGDETGRTYSFVSVNNQSVSINATENMTIDGIYLSCRNGNTFNNETFYPMLRYADTDSTYEPYTSSTLSLPISTYFPSGMKQAGDVYDELTESKAITRIWGYKITGQETVYSWGSGYGSHYGGSINVPLPDVLVGADVKGVASDGYVVAFANNDKTIYTNGNGRFAIINDAYTTQEAWLSGIKDVEVYFVLATPTEISFTTASLVTENAEIPLSNEDGVLIGKCTEQLSSESGFFDAKIKLSDGDGTCYSNKLQLHVERSPQ